MASTACSTGLAAASRRAGEASTPRRAQTARVAVRSARPSQRQSTISHSVLEGTNTSGTVATDSTFTYEAFEALLDKYDFKFRVGDKVTGIIFKVDNKGAYVDVGAKSAAFCPTPELSLCKVSSVRAGVKAGTVRPGWPGGVAGRGLAFPGFVDDDPLFQGPPPPSPPPLLPVPLPTGSRPTPLFLFSPSPSSFGESTGASPRRPV